MTPSGVALLMGLSTAFAILWLVRRDQLHAAHGISWLTLASAIATVAIFPALGDQIAAAVGVAYTPALLLAASVMILFIKALSSDIQNARMKIRLVRLTQRLAILEARITNAPPQDDASATDQVD